MNYQTLASGILHMSCFLRSVERSYISNNPSTRDITTVHKSKNTLLEEWWNSWCSKIVSFCSL